MASDVPPERFQPMRSVYLSLSLDSTEEAEHIYALLSDGGETDYYSEATRMEALLLLGDVTASHALVPQTIKANGGDHAALR